MAEYKGYTIEEQKKGHLAFVSPYKETIAILVLSLDGESVHINYPGIKERWQYTNRRERFEDFVEQHRALIGLSDEEPIITPPEARIIIIETVENLHINSNLVQVQISAEKVEEVKIAVEKTDSGILKTILKEWIPKALVGSGVDELLALLGVG